MSSRSVYHLNLDAEAIEGATLALVPGDPGRVQALAVLAPFTGGRELACKREYRTWIAYMHGRPVLVTSTGIGGPSASIAIDELAQLGVRTFIRVGTTGAIQPHVNIGDVVITTGAVRLDGASTQYAPIEYPAVADHAVVEALIQAARDTDIPAHAGITCTCDTFYPGQERYDSYTGYVPRRFQGITEEWRRLQVLNYEMEAATLLTMTSAMGLRGGSVCGVVVNRTRAESIEHAHLALAEANGVKVAVRAVERLVEEGA